MNSLHIDGYVLFSVNNVLNWLTFAIIVWSIFHFKKANEKRHEMLQEINKLLKESKEKDKFASMAAHEIKNPLTVIKMYADLIERQGGNGKAKAIQKEVDKILRLINTLFDYSKLINNNYQLKKQWLDLKTVITEKIASFKVVYPDRNITFQTQLETAPIYSDQLALDQIITNLTVNAIRYTTKGVVIQLKNSKRYYIILVIDQGDGIPIEARKALWQAFSKESTQGLGLGLFIAKQLVTQLNGKIQYITGKTGTTFTILLPNRKEGGEETDEKV